MRQTQQNFEKVEETRSGLTDSQIKLMMLKESLARRPFRQVAG